MADQVQVSGTVRTASPLTIWVDGAETSCPAATIKGQAYHSGDRVQVTLRNPVQPLVQGPVES